MNIQNFAMDPGAYSAGTALNRQLDALGLPDKVGDFMGAALDLQTGNVAGAQRNLFDAYSGMSTKQLDRMESHHRMPPFGSLMGPALMLQTMQVMGGLGGMPGFSPFGGSAAGSQGLFGPLQDLMSRFTNGLGGAPGSSAGGGSQVGAGTGGNDVNSILNDPSLSLEDKMAMVLMALASRQEKQLEQKMQELGNVSGGTGGAGGAAGAGGAGGLGGLLQSVGGLVGTAAGAEFGPLGMALGGLFGSAAGQKVGSMVDGGTSGTGGGQKSEQTLTQELQMIQQKMQRLLETLSNVMKSFHDTSMQAIGNIR
ncbi:MAG TPA: hypothetical protein VLX28_22300 [Thermoanaerobaculia bacterium]|nr:hypothetical protein [Thermoanaerobaculia bacterium]